MFQDGSVDIDVSCPDVTLAGFPVGRRIAPVPWPAGERPFAVRNSLCSRADHRASGNGIPSRLGPFDFVSAQPFPSRLDQTIPLTVQVSYFPQPFGKVTAASEDHQSTSFFSARLPLLHVLPAEPQCLDARHPVGEDTGPDRALRLHSVNGISPSRCEAVQSLVARLNEASIPLKVLRANVNYQVNPLELANASSPKMVGP